MNDNPHFNQLYWFCVLTLILGFGYIIAVTFILIPKENQRIVDTSTGFVLGSMIMSAIGFLLGGNPSAQSSKRTADGTTSAEITASITSENKEEGKP